MDPHRSVLIAYAAMEVCNPVSLDLIDRALSVASIAPGARTLDLGCGTAAMSIHLAQAFDLRVDALERSPAVCAIAAAKIESQSAADRVILHNVESAAFLKAAEPYDLLVCAGASRVVSDSHEPAAILAALAPHVRPGGFVLWADPYWKTTPNPALAAMVGQYATYRSHAENIAAGEGAGMTCWYAGASSEQDWDDYSWRITAANLAWLDANPEHPDAAGVRQHIDFMRGVYLSFGREALGFGVYLFRK